MSFPLSIKLLPQLCQHTAHPISTDGVVLDRKHDESSGWLYFTCLICKFTERYCLEKRYRAVYDYAAADDDEVSFMDGDVIVDVQQIDEGWMYGRVERTGQQGMLPANYVEAI
ncbi:hypothetical protein XENOCAPTIV_008024 [Xenoophorus captivus]|uniref:SH3 domain-containing protein n=1 Tax=Xenoophorus captivus TaxID=1517983 RepID=A0ABV0QLN1_9TELE